MPTPLNKEVTHQTHRSNSAPKHFFLLGLFKPLKEDASSFNTEGHFLILSILPGNCTGTGSTISTKC